MTSTQHVYLYIMCANAQKYRDSDAFTNNTMDDRLEIRNIQSMVQEQLCMHIYPYTTM
jgi:hypothetical protein